jgi:hypothetical protein
VALQRAAAFCRVVAAGRADRAHTTDVQDPEAASAQTRRAASMLSTAEDLEVGARLWHAGELI